MKLRYSLFLAAAGILASSLAIATPAHAAAPANTGAANPGPGAVVLHAPPAPAGARTDLGGAVPNTTSPSVTPGASKVYADPGGTYTCAVGTLCVGVWDPVHSLWAIFYLVQCHTYTLNFWAGDGFYYDNQTGGVTSFIYNQLGGILISFVPRPTQYNFDWNPAWSVKNC